MLDDESPKSFNLNRALSLLRRRGPIVVVCVLIAAGSAYAFARHKPKQYTATSSLLFTTNQLGLVAAGLGGTGQQPLSQSQQDTNVKLIGLGDTAAKTAAQLGPKWTPGMVKAAISLSPAGDTSIVEIAASARVPRLAQKIANTYATVFVAEQQQQTTAQIASAQRLITSQLNELSPAQKAGPQGTALADRAQTLSILAKLDSGNVSVAGLAGLPRAPTSPTPSRDAMLGGVLGLLIGIGIAFALERMDRGIRDPTELAEIHRVPLLAAVPEREDYRKVATRLATSRESWQLSPHEEVFNLLRSYLRYFAVDRDLQALLVISADQGDGKTTVSYNLAKAAAALGSRVLLIEADLRRGTLIDPIGEADRPRAALPDVLAGSASMEQAVRSFEVGPTGVLDVLVAGEFMPPNPGELIESRAMESLLEHARAAYDLVVIDTPPLGVVADAIPLLSKVDGVIIVGRMRTSTRDAAEQLHNRLKSLRAPVLGVVANRVRGDLGSARRQKYGYVAASHREPGKVVLTNGSSRSNGSADITAASSQPHDDLP